MSDEAYSSAQPQKWTITDQYEDDEQYTVSLGQGQKLRAQLNDFGIDFRSNSTTPSSSYRLRAAKLLMADPGFDHNKPTVIYAHGQGSLILAIHSKFKSNETVTVR